VVTPSRPVLLPNTKTLVSVVGVASSAHTRLEISSTCQSTQMLPSTVHATLSAAMKRMTHAATYQRFTLGGVKDGSLTE
jgi:hypothetical protein